MNIIAEFKGQNGKIILYDDYLELNRKNFGGLMAQRGLGERRYFYKDITTVEYKKPSFIFNGYFKVIVSGTKDTNAKVGLFSSSSDSAKDQNTIILRAFSKSVGEETDRIFEIIMKKLADAKNSTNATVLQSSRMDELKKLAELRSTGILTEEEFELKSKKF